MSEQEKAAAKYAGSKYYPREPEYHIAEAAFIHGANWQRKRSGWISVDDAMKPKDNQWVHCAALVNGKYDILLPSYLYSERYDTFTGYGEPHPDERVTHYMPLPTPPKS